MNFKRRGALCVAYSLFCFFFQRIFWLWPKTALRGSSTYLVGASIAAAIVALIDLRLWQILPVALASVCLAYVPYADYVKQLEEKHRRREVIDFLEQGMSVVDRDGRGTLWNDALERMLGCSRDRALGQSLDAVVPALALQKTA